MAGTFLSAMVGRVRDAVMSLCGYRRPGNMRRMDGVRYIAGYMEEQHTVYNSPETDMDAAGEDTMLCGDVDQHASFNFGGYNQDTPGDLYVIHEETNYEMEKEVYWV